MRTYIRKVAYGQRLKRYPLSSIVRPCTMLDNEFDQMSNSLLHRTTSIRGRSKSICGFWSGSVKTPPEESSSGKKIQAESAVAARQSAINIKREESRKNNS